MADEPTGSLASETAERVMTLLRQLNEEGLTIIMVTHNPDACRHGNRTILVRGGYCLTH